MGNRALQLATLLVALGVGVGAAYGVKAVRDVSTQQASVTSTPSPSPSSATQTATSPSLSTSPLASPSPSPVPSLSPAPAAPPRSASAAAYPPQIQAGSTYNYAGRGSLALVASDRKDSGSAICAGIANTSQTIPSGYLAAYFVSVTFSDGQVMSSGLLRMGGTSNDFGQLQNRSGKAGNKSSDPTGAGTHTYCVQRSGSSWVASADGTVIMSTTNEPATSTAGASLAFESTIQQTSAGTPVPLAFVVPGFSGIAIDGSAPTQLIGSTQLF